ncbi:hypothetical protein BOTBODRAFT_178861 [Botryobasidium botryosum FD-172 SS1]|uniref:DUF6532 domain-containing protein n=1 Tax=Botryobasidium botryosum (strain FD-172 SS1) TaxID=930990 RepID=A0A067MCM2_BOTB1|nr:hypothetical protein BOTBODRAFT_178861 [Botryobasidium botryosum FD-172 SS1]
MGEGTKRMIAQDLIPVFYRFLPNGVHQNRAIYKRLITENAYLYEDSSKLVGIWFSPLLFTLVHDMWFKKPEDDGLQCPQYFHPKIPLPTIALVYTTWSQGYFRGMKLETRPYSNVYSSLLDGLMRLHNNPESRMVTDGLGSELLDLSRSHAAKDTNKSSFPESANANAARDYIKWVERKKKEREADVVAETSY